MHDTVEHAPFDFHIMYVHKRLATASQQINRACRESQQHELFEHQWSTEVHLSAYRSCQVKCHCINYIISFMWAVMASTTIKSIIDMASSSRVFRVRKLVWQCCLAVWHAMDGIRGCMMPQLPSGALFSIFWGEGSPFKANKPKTDADPFSSWKSTGHLRNGRFAGLAVMPWLRTAIHEISMGNGSICRLPPCT